MINITAIDVAKWMVKELDEQEFLYPEWAVWEIQEIFGDDFVSENENGNLTISKVVLRIPQIDRRRSGMDAIRKSLA